MNYFISLHNFVGILLIPQQLLFKDEFMLHIKGIKGRKKKELKTLAILNEELLGSQSLDDLQLQKNTY